MIDGNKTRRLFAAGAALVMGLSAVAAAGVGAQSTASASKAKASGSKAVAGSSSTTNVKKTGKKSTARRRVVGQRAPTPERIREIQTALAGAGAYAAKPTGQWDAATVAALKKFQKDKGLAPDGKLDARTLQALGLGSQVAGVAAPRPPVAPPSSPDSK